MLNTSKGLYLISAVFSAIGAVGSLICAVMADAVTQLIEESAKEYWKELSKVTVEWIGIGILVGAIVGIIVCLVQVGLSVYGYVSLSKNSKSIVPHVVTIVFGAFGNLFLLIGGIVAVVALIGSKNRQKSAAPIAYEEQQEKF